MSNLLKHAEKELRILCDMYPTEDNPPIIKEFIPEILSLVNKFAESGQSGGSAPYTAGAVSSAIKKLCLFEPITPIMGTDDEWVNISEEMGGRILYQNNREGGLFKNPDGSVHYIYAITWKDTKGATWSGTAIFNNTPDEKHSIGSKNFLVRSFPFIPKTFVIDVIGVEVGKDNWEFYVKDEDQLRAAKEYYQFTLSNKTN
jgi:hypothetical protein